jgi:hypothetical protein
MVTICVFRQQDALVFPRMIFYCTTHAAKYEVAERVERCASTFFRGVGDPHAGDRGALDLQSW